MGVDYKLVALTTVAGAGLGAFSTWFYIYARGEDAVPDKVAAFGTGVGIGAGTGLLYGVLSSVYLHPR
jgi:hypothetical protein